MGGLTVARVKQNDRSGVKKERGDPKRLKRDEDSLTFDPAEHFEWSLDDLLAQNPPAKGTSPAASPAQDQSSTAKTNMTGQGNGFTKITRQEK
jgi:hypothetical protein